METTKIDILSKRIEEYKNQLLPELDYYVQQHNKYLKMIEGTGFNNPESDPVLLGPAVLAKIELWYSLARKEAYNISGKSRDLQKFYLAVAEQGKANQYELVRMGKYDEKLNNATDAREIARRISGRLEERAAHFEGEYTRWSGIANAYESAANAAKDLFKLAEYEWQLSRRA